MKAVLYIVTPCFNEEDTLPFTAPVMLSKLEELICGGIISADSKVLFVDDGSRDNTWEIISSLCKKDKRCAGLKLAHNSGEQNAHIAGMNEAIKKADCVITADCDLQDDISAVNEMLQRYYEGCDVVYGVRRSRDKDSVFKKVSARLFYKFLSRLDGDVIPEHSNYRLMSRRAVRHFAEFDERIMFMPALVTKLGLKTAVVEHDRLERDNGTSKYSLKKMLKLATDAVTSFSSFPLVFLTAFAIFSFAVSFSLFVIMLAQFVKYRVLSMALAAVCSIWAVCFILCAGMRIVAEYVVKNYFETKHRPRYQIENKLNLDEDENEKA